MMDSRPDSPNDYNPEQRTEVSWWSSRRGRGIRGSGSLKKLRRITLIDLLLLAVAAGVLVPWFLSMDQGEELAGYLTKFSIVRHAGFPTLKLEISLDDEADPGIALIVGWRLFDSDGSLIAQESDIPPEPGESRIFRRIIEGEYPGRVEIFVDDEILQIEPVK